MYELIGFAGALLIILAWAFETIEGVKKHKALIDLKFSVISLAATFILFFYSWLNNDAVFIYLNLVLFVILSLEIWYTIHIKKVHKKKKR